MMKKYSVILLVILFACSPPKEKLEETIVDAEEVLIRENFHGGIAGGGTNDYTLKKSKIGEDLYEWILIKNEGTDFQTFISLDSSDLKSFELFIRKSFESHEPDREYHNSCVFNDPSDYEFKVGFSKVQLKPSIGADSIFQKLSGKFYRKE